MWGNPRLVMWDYGKEITITLEDALMSLESLRFMLGGAIKDSTKESVVVRHTEEVVCTTGGAVPKPKDHLDGITMTPKAWKGHPIRLINLTKGYRTQILDESAEHAANGTSIPGDKAISFQNPKALASPAATEQGDHIRIFWEEEVLTTSTSETAVEVTISPNTYPGTYRVVGDTFMRSEATGKDEAFQFVINKAKVSSEVTFQLQAEGDPSTFSMTLNVLRSKNDSGDDEMMKLVRYTLGSGASATVSRDWEGSIVTSG